MTDLILQESLPEKLPDLMAEALELYDQLVLKEDTEEIKALRKQLKGRQLKFCYLLATGKFTQQECMVGAGYSIRSGGNNAALIRKKGSARQAITYFQGELECRHGIPAENHRRFLKRVRDANEKENPKVSLQAEKQLMELDGHIGTAKSQRSGNVSINISGLMPGSISIEQQPIEGTVVPGPTDNK